MAALTNWNDEFDDPVGPVSEILSRASKEHGDGVVEAFLRASTSSRIELDGQTGEVIKRTGREQGGALRWVDARTGAVGFAASSGGAWNSLEACRALALETPGSPVAGCPWNAAANPLSDLDEGIAPDFDELCDWLRSTAPDGLDRAWVEVGTSSEWWLTDPETVQKRRRQRVWACWERLEDGLHGPRPRFLAARSWSLLRRIDPRRRLFGDQATGPGERPWPDGAKLVFSPETSAFLALLLARVAHYPGAREGAPVGPGWVAVSGCRNTLFGARRDDAGFPAEERSLADGRKTVGRWGGPGQLRRGSFRDVPDSTPIPLVVSPPPVDPPRRAIHVTRVDVHPSGTAWTVRLHGREYPDGAPFEPKWIRLDPFAVLESCLGGVGPAFESHSGVTTPALVFDTLLLR